MIIKKSVSKFYLIFIGILIISFDLVWAEGWRFRKYAGEFLEIGVAARAEALGGSYTALANDVTAAYYNPAGLRDVKTAQASFMHTQQMLASVNYDFIAFAKPQSENRIFSLSLIRLGIDHINDSREAQVFFENDPENWRIDWAKVKSFNAADYIFIISVAQKMKQGWWLGGNIKLIRRSLAEHSGNGLGVDIAVQKSLFDKFRFGANLKNTTTTLIAWDTGEKELVKPALFIGGAGKIPIASIKSNLRPVMDIILRSEGIQKSAQLNFGTLSLDFTGGIEYDYRGVLFVRAGVDQISRMALGTGIQIPHIRIDYAYTHYDTEIGNSHRIGLIVQF